MRKKGIEKAPKSSKGANSMKMRVEKEVLTPHGLIACVCKTSIENPSPLRTFFTKGWCNSLGIPNGRQTTLIPSANGRAILQPRRHHFTHQNWTCSHHSTSVFSFFFFFLLSYFSVLCLHHQWLASPKSISSRLPGSLISSIDWNRVRVFHFYHFYIYCFLE